MNNYIYFMSIYITLDILNLYQYCRVMVLRHLMQVIVNRMHHIL